jgi:hypothetical protein
MQVILSREITCGYKRNPVKEAVTRRLLEMAMSARPSEDG